MLIVISRTTIKKITLKNTVKETIREFRWHTRNIYMMQKKKFTNMWILENILLKTQWVKEETTMEIRNYFEMNENENTMYQTL